MATLGDVVAYLCEHYPYKDELSKARLTKLVYLADWKSAIERGEQMTDVEWIFNHFGPYVDDVANQTTEDDAFDIEDTHNFYGYPKSIIKLVKSRESPSLSDEDKRILDSVIETTKRQSWNQFLRLVYSTYPVLTQDRFSRLDLAALAKSYADDQASLPT